MEGYTITEMAGLLEISPDNVLKRLQRKGIRPKNREVLYDKTALEEIRVVKPIGRPKKAAPEKPKKAK
jgi:hypothetical protein